MSACAIIKAKRVINMINARSEAIKLLNAIPDDKMLYVVNILRNVNDMTRQEVEPDELDLTMLREAEKDHEEAVSFQQAIEGLGFDINELCD